MPRPAPLPGSADGADYTEIAWLDDDALQIDFPVSRLAGRVLQERLSTVWGNIVPADHGETVEDPLPPVPERGRYDPVLPRVGLTFRQPFDAAAARQQPAARALRQIAWQALPDIELMEVPVHFGSGEESEAHFPVLSRWQPRYDLLNSGRFARDFVVEMDENGYAHLRFGDGAGGRVPAAGTRFRARYRVGVGPRGNVGAHAIHHVVLDRELKRELSRTGLTIRYARNHLSGEGGETAKPTEHAQVYAPDIIHSFAYQRRCVTENDHAELAQRHPEVVRAVARQYWSGSSTTVALYVQRHGGLAIDGAFEARLRAFLEPFLLVGCDLTLRDPRWVPGDPDDAGARARRPGRGGLSTALRRGRAATVLRSGRLHVRPAGLPEPHDGAGDGGARGGQRQGGPLPALGPAGGG